jgi:hypothetical protein
MTTVFIKAGALWVILVILAILNGIIRETLLVSIFGPRLALPLSGILLAVLIFAVTVVLIPWLGRLTAPYYWLVGMLWACLTVIFEFSFGLYVGGHSLETLLAAYDLTSGNLWLAVLIMTLVSPYLAARRRGMV